MKKSILLSITLFLLISSLCGCMLTPGRGSSSQQNRDVELGVPVDRFVDRYGKDHDKEDMLSLVQSMAERYHKDEYVRGEVENYDALPAGATVPDIQSTADFTLAYENDEYTLTATVPVEGGYTMVIYFHVPNPRETNGKWLESVGVSFMPDPDAGVTAPADEDEDILVTKSFGTYSVSAGWVELREMSTDQKPFYVKEGISTRTATSNISIEVDENPYAKEDHMEFQRAILSQFSMQVEAYKEQTGETHSELNGSGFTSDKGEIIYKFEIEFEDSTVIQYYIVEDYKFCMVYATDFKDERIPDVEEAALAIVNSFEWV